MDFSQLKFSGVAVYIFLILALLIFVMLLIANNYIPGTLKKKSTRKQFNRVFPIFEFFVWIIFLVWAIEYFLKRNYVFAFAVVFILFTIGLLLSRFAFKEYIAGIVFKSSGNFNIGEKIEYKGNSGTILRFSYQFLEIEIDNGKIMYIPYSNLSESETIKSAAEEISINKTFNLTIETKDTIEESINRIKKVILCSPWTLSNKEPEIKYINTIKNIQSFEIQVATIDEEYIYKIENFVKKTLK